MLKKPLAAGVALVALALPVTAQAYAWHTVATKSASGAFTIKSFSRTVNAPHGLRLKAGNSKGRAIVDWTLSCSKGFNIKANGGTWHPGVGTTYKTLPMGMTNPGSCLVVLAISPSINGGTVTVALQRR